MRIEFKDLKIRNFKSIGEADIDLQSQGIVKVLGVYEYEDNLIIHIISVWGIIANEGY